MTSDEIRETYLSFFEQRDHLRLPSASLVPAAYDPSVLLTTAGMHPLMPYFLQQERPPHPRLTSCQKCFRTVDIDIIGTTHRHLTFFEMLGNFSIGDYFKQDAIAFAWELSTQGFGFDPERHLGDRLRRRRGARARPRRGGDRAVAGDRRAARADRRVPALGELLAGGADRSVRAVQRAVPRPRASTFGAQDDLPGGENERFLEFWNLVFMTFKQEPAEHAHAAAGARTSTPASA